jgi:predicted outer membrane repeat protein
LTDVTFQENDAPLGGGLYASPNSNSILTRVTFRQNTATFGGGIYMLGSVGNYAYILATNSTFSGNTASSNGGGVHSSMGDISLTNVTFSDNSASGSGGGLYTDDMSAAYFRNTIVANSTGGDCLSLNGSGGSSLNSLFEDAVNTCSAVNGVSGNLTGIDPVLGSYQSYGITGTHPLLANSPAINAGTNSGCPATDMRGVSRPQGGVCDMGAFEKEILTLNYRSLGANDGYLRESTETSNVGGYANANATVFYVGDDAANKQYKGLLHFNTASLPDTAVIVRVTLKLKQQGVVGTDPFTTHGSLTVDMRRPTFGASGLAMGDFQVTAGRSAVATFGAPVNNWYSALLNSAGRLYLNLTGTTEFRLAFSTDDNNDNGADYVKFFSGNHATTSVQPLLVVEYYLP